MSRRRWGDPLAKNPGRRQARVNDLLRRQISDILQKEYSDRIEAMVTITEVRTTGDLHHARIFAAILAAENQQNQVIKTLQNTRQELRQQLASRVVLKYIPTLEFILDDSAERAQHIEELLQQNDSSKKQD